MNTAIFYDGSHVITGFNTYKPNHYNNIDFSKLNKIVLNKIKTDCFNEPLKIFAGWYQGISSELHNIDIHAMNTKKQEDSDKLKNNLWKYVNQHRLWVNLSTHGIETTFLLKKENENEKEIEKGIDVALTISAMNLVTESNVDIIVLVTNDGDFKPLIHNLKKKGITVFVVAFEEKEKISCNLKQEAFKVFSVSKNDCEKVYSE